MERIGGKANLLTYKELQKYKSLDEALGPYEAIVLLYETKDHFGHWVCVFKFDEDTVEHFDSYGLKPDDELKFIPENYRKVNYVDYPHLTALLYFSDYNVVFNEKKLQKHLKDVNTCGRWVTTRLNYRMIPQEEFADFFLEYKNPDELITYLTS